MQFQVASCRMGSQGSFCPVVLAKGSGLSDAPKWELVQEVGIQVSPSGQAPWATREVTVSLTIGSAVGQDPQALCLQREPC